LIAVLAAGTSAAHANQSSARSCSSYKAKGVGLTDVRVRRVSCAQAKRMLVRFYHTAAGLNCANVRGRPASYFRCTARVAAERNAAGSGTRFVTAVIAFLISPCEACEYGI
jgi:hypothetical protein